MIKPNKVKPEHVLCFSCGSPIHISELGGVTKEGFLHNNICCILKILDKLEGDKLT